MDLKFPTGLRVLLIVTFIVKMLVLGKYGLAGDEKYSLIDSQFLVQEGVNQKNSIRNPLSNTFTSQEFWAPKNFDDFKEAMARRENGSGAAYFLLLHYWTKLFGVSDFSLRFISLLFTFCICILGYYFSILLFKQKSIALITSILLLFSPFLFDYGLIARNYAFTYFWFSLATYCLFVIIKDESEKRKWYYLYALSLVFTIFGHHSAYIIYPLHGLVFLIHRNYKKTIPLLLAGIPSIGLFLVWLRSEGGKYAFEYIENSRIQYLEWAKAGVLEYANPGNIFTSFSHTFSSLFIPLNNQLNFFNRPKQILFLGILAMLVYLAQNFIKKTPIKWLITLGLFAIPNFILLPNPLKYIGVISGLWIFFETVLFKKINNKTIWYLWILGFIPLIILINYVITDNVLIRMNPRYAGFGFLFICLLLAKGLHDLYVKNDLIKLSYFGLFIALVCGIESSNIMRDLSPPYFHYTPAHRIKNPYQTVASTIYKLYEKGDTLIHCSQALPKLPNNVEMPEYSYQDAQYIGVYFPKNGKNIVQTIDHTEPNKVFLKKRNGNKLLIFDFKGTTYRY